MKQLFLVVEIVCKTSYWKSKQTNIKVTVQRRLFLLESHISTKELEIYILIGELVQVCEKQKMTTNINKLIMQEMCFVKIR